MHTSDNGQGKLTQDDWARIWFSKLAKFHKVHDAKKWRFQQDDVVAFLKSKVKAGGEGVALPWLVCQSFM